jgi:hypothetical protein
MLGTGLPAYAGPIVFDFNSLADGQSNSFVQSYMRDVLFNELGLVNAVTVTGAKAEKNYTGDNHVVGPVSGTTVTSLTLGNSDQGVQHALPWDTYIVNSNDIKITMLFTFPIYNVSFDFEIFPNHLCGNPSNSFPTPPKGDCNVWPDFTFKAGDALSTTEVFHVMSLDPSNPPSGYTGYTHSPISGSINTEKSPQLLGVTETFVFPQGVTKLEFYDWPEQIGIDNLTINQVPEPGTMVMLGVGLAGICIRRRRST